MKKIRLYQAIELSPNLEINLNENNKQHLKALRVNSNKHSISLFNHKEEEYNCEIITISHKTITLKIKEEIIREKYPTHLEIAQCLCKSDTNNLIIQKAVELGVSNFQPILSDYSPIKINSQNETKKQTQWQRIIQQATEQSQRIDLMQIQPILNIQTYLNEKKQELLILDPYQTTTNIKTWLQKNKKPYKILIGPEGGLSQRENNLINELKINKTSLSNNILRAETASISAISIIQYHINNPK